MRLAAPALARLSPTFEEPRIPLREMADELSAELAEAKKAFHTANTNWVADPDNFALKEVMLRADLAVKEIEFKIKEAKVEELVAQGKGEDDAQVKAAKAARDDAREERNKAEARLDEFTKSAAAPQGIPPSFLRNSPSLGAISPSPSPLTLHYFRCASMMTTCRAPWAHLMMLSKF